MKKILISFVVLSALLFVFGCEMPTGSVVENTPKETTEEETTEEETTEEETTEEETTEEPALYPTIVWANGQSPSPSVLSRSIVTSAATKYDEMYKGLNFEASYSSMTSEFGFVLAVGDMGFYTLSMMPVDSNGDNTIDSSEFNGIFANHTVEVDVIYQSGGIDKVYTISFNMNDASISSGYTLNDAGIFVEMEVDYVDVNGDLVFMPSDNDYTLATFREIRFIADDLTVYHIWTNPDL